MPGTPTPNFGIATMSGAADAGSTIDDTHNSAMTTIDTALLKSLWLPINFSVMDEVRVPSGANDVLPQVFVPVKAGQTVKLTRCRYSITSGTSVTFKIQRNGVDATGFTGIVASTTVAETDPTDITLANNDRLQLVVTAVSGTPRNFSVAMILEHAV